MVGSQNVGRMSQDQIANTVSDLRDLLASKLPPEMQGAFQAVDQAASDISAGSDGSGSAGTIVNHLS
jgi:hypothetical protein